MKKIKPYSAHFLLVLLFFLSFIIKIDAQDCTFPQASKELNGNKISANILNGGDLFWDRANAAFSSEDSQNPSASSIFNSGIWIGGFTGIAQAVPNLKLSASTYPSSTSNDYYAGPLSGNGTINSTTCSDFDRLWEVSGSEIAAHIADFEDDGMVDFKHPNIYAYPGHQNPFFVDFHSFTLPNTPQGLAPFFDRDADGIYNPDNGDYPLPSSVDKNNFPEHLIWGVFNDNGSNHTLSQGDALQFEIQLTAWAFSCSENDVLNNTIFTSHKIINKALSRVDTLHVGMFTDFDLGCFTDDFVGSIPDLNTFYCYNADEEDGSAGTCINNVPAYGDNPPVQAVTYLNHDMDYFMTTVPPSMITINGGPSLPFEFYRLLTGSWIDGVPLTQGGNGYSSGGQPTSFLFDGNPNDPNAWSMTTANITDGDFRTVSSINVDSLLSGQTITIDMAYTFYQDENLNNIETVNLVYDNTPNLQQWYDNRFISACSGITSLDNLLEKNQILIFPNPTTHLLNVKLENSKSAAFEVFDIYGKKVFEKAESFNSDFQLPMEQLSEGVYFLKVKMERKEIVKKIIKI